MNLPHQNERSDSALDSIEHELYDPRKKMDDVVIHHTRDRGTMELPTSWGDNSPMLVEGEKERGLSFGVKFLLFSILLLISALSFTAWRVTSLRNVVSPSNMGIETDITPYVEGGESVPLSVTLSNKNVSQLSSTSLTLSYKKGIGQEDEQEKIHEKREIGTINPNEFKQQNFDVVLYGSEAESRDLTLKLEYKIAGSNNVFSKVITTSTILKTPPITVHIDGPKTLSVGQNGTFTITVKNNSATTSLPSVLNLALPNTFSVVSSEPKSSTRGTVWKVPPIKSGESKSVTVVGNINGTQGETITMKALIGSEGDTPTTVGVVYSSLVMDIKLRTSPLLFDVTLDTGGGAGIDVLRYGDKAGIVIAYSNVSQAPLQDASIKMIIDGDAPLYKKIDPGVGYYDSTNNEISWNKESVPELTSLLPGESGTLRLYIPIALSGSNAPTLKISITGKASSDGADDVVSTVVKTYGVKGSASLNAQTVYRNSLFPNSGPIPPVANTETTYTARINVSAQHALVNSRVSFTLPAYVTWRDVTSEDKSTVKYDTRSRTVTWFIGNMSADDKKSIDIGLSIKPSQAHVGQVPAITSGIVFDAGEEVSKAHIRTERSALSTSISGEAWEEDSSHVVDR